MINRGLFNLFYYLQGLYYFKIGHSRSNFISFAIKVHMTDLNPFIIMTYFDEYISLFRFIHSFALVWWQIIKEKLGDMDRGKVPEDSLSLIAYWYKNHWNAVRNLNLLLKVQTLACLDSLNICVFKQLRNKWWSLTHCKRLMRFTCQFHDIYIMYVVSPWLTLWKMWSSKWWLGAYLILKKYTFLSKRFSM